MNAILWILQSFLAFIFLYQGICKVFFKKHSMPYFGQTSVKEFPVALIRFIGICEILGAYGLVIPLWVGILPFLAPLSALCLAIIMVLAMGINLSKKIYKNLYINIILFLFLMLIFIGRINLF